MEVYKTIDVDECTMRKEHARKCKDLDRGYRYSPRGKGEDAIAKQACVSYKHRQQKWRRLRTIVKS